MSNDQFPNLKLFRIYVTKSKAGHYTATARHTLHGGLIKKTVIKHGSAWAAKNDLNSMLGKEE